MARTAMTPDAGRRCAVRGRRGRRGIVYVLALIVLSLMMILATAMATQSSLNLAQSDNQVNILQARLAAESGVEFMLLQFAGVRVAQAADANSLAGLIQQSLAAQMNGTGNLGGSGVTLSGATVTVPTITLGGQTFACTLNCLTTSQVRLTVTGTFAGVSRRVQLDFNVIVKRAGAFDYGLACRGPVTVSGSARLLGVNSPGEASVFSATTSTANAITVSGNSTVGGDLNVVGSTSTVTISGSPSIGDTSDSQLWPQHCHFDVTAPDFPQYDTSTLAPLATTTIDANTNISKLGTLTNVRIKAGTNPTFSSKTTINGIVYIEAPNKVSFSGQATVNGLIVTQPATPDQLSNCQISFSGSVEAFGVEALPNTPAYAAVKQATGTFILAPGFGVTFSGHVSAVNGNIAADQLTFSGTADGTVKGSIVGLRDLPSTLSGNVDIYIDSKNAVQNPAGFVTTYMLVPNSDTYAEVSAP
jgi:hypothetical protein